MDLEITEEKELSRYDILAIAVQVERDGIEFYRKAAQLFGDSDAGAIFYKLLQWEQTHVAIFCRMRDDLAKEGKGRDTHDLNGADLSEFRMMAGLAMFGVYPDPTNECTGCETKEDVLRAAVQKEKDAVVFYTGIKDFVPDPDDQATVDSIIKEEVQRVRILCQALE